jgi:hypothetical protein
MAEAEKETIPLSMPVSEADKRASLDDITAQLSREMTIVSTKPIAPDRPATRTPVTLTGLHLITKAGTLDVFHLPKYQTNGWDRFVARVKRAVSRYSDLVVRVDFVVVATTWSDQTIQALEMNSLNVDVDHYRLVSYNDTTGLYTFRLYAVMLPTQDPGLLLTPSSLHEAIDHAHPKAVEIAIKAGVNVNSTWTDSMLARALIRTVSQSNTPFAADSVSVFNLIASQPDMDWDLRAANGDALLQQTLDVDVCVVQHLLPWDKIDLDTCNDRGDNILHSCCRYDSGGSDEVCDRIVTLIHLLLRHGARELVLRLNDDGKRPSEVSRSDRQGLLIQAEREAAHISSTCLSHFIGVSVLVRLVMAYYTTF